MALDSDSFVEAVFDADIPKTWSPIIDWCSHIDLTMAILRESVPNIRPNIMKITICRSLQKVAAASNSLTVSTIESR